MQRIIRKIAAVILIFSMYSGSAYAQSMNSTNYKLVDTSINSGGGFGTGTSLKTFESVGDFASDPRKSSSYYSLRSGPAEEYTLEAPEILCFEVFSYGSDLPGSPMTDCTRTIIAHSGMLGVCGPTGCYNKAHFEIDDTNFPSDVVFSIQVSTTSDFSTGVMYVDGTTFELKSSRTINDFLSANDWRYGGVNGANVIGLTPGKQYWLRATVLNADFTESEPGPSATVTTSVPYIGFDIDIADTTGLPSSDVPYNLQMILPAGIISYADKLIWLNVDTNLQDGVIVYQTGLYGGLSNGTSTDIPSATEDLATASKGFGLQHYDFGTEYFTCDDDISCSSNWGFLGTLGVESIYEKTYSGRTENVGQIPLSPTLSNAYNSTQPLYHAKAGIYVMGKSDSTVSVCHHTETITFILLPNY